MNSLDKKSCQRCESSQVGLSGPLAPHTHPKLPTKNKTSQRIPNAARGRSLNLTVNNKLREEKKKCLTTEQNALMNKHSRLRQRSNSRKQERVIAGYNNNTPDTDTAHRNSSDTVSGRLISQLLCLYEKRWQPSLAFNSTQAPI